MKSLLLISLLIFGCTTTPKEPFYPGAIVVPTQDLAAAKQWCWNGHSIFLQQGGYTYLKCK